MANPQIDMDKCNGCGLCTCVCPQAGLAMSRNKVAFIGGEKCTWCGMCEAVCASGAIGCPFDIILDEL